MRRRLDCTGEGMGYQKGGYEEVCILGEMGEEETINADEERQKRR